jgi:hypothetical protein
MKRRIVLPIKYWHDEPGPAGKPYCYWATTEALYSENFSHDTYGVLWNFMSDEADRYRILCNRLSGSATGV